MKITGVNHFQGKNAYWYLIEGVEKYFNKPNAKGYTTVKHWIADPTPEDRDLLVPGKSVEVLYKKVEGRDVAFHVVETDDDIDFDF